MHFAMKSRRTRIWVWLVWGLVVIAFLTAPGALRMEGTQGSMIGVVLQEEEAAALFPWTPRQRWKKWVWRHYQGWRERYRRAQRVAGMARLAMAGMIPMAQVVDWLTASQVRYQVGALPVLYALLETLKVRAIINRHCPTRADVDHGTVALVMVLNRLMFPLPLYQVADWVAQTVLAVRLGIPAAKFNDDRLERTLDALYPHLEAIWWEIVQTAFAKADIDLSVVFYDLTAFVAHGRYAGSEVVDFGFAHNVPSNKRKFKLALNTTGDGNLPWLYRLCSGRTIDLATVEENMTRLARYLRVHGQTGTQTLVVGDRAMLDAQIAIHYAKTGLRYLCGLRCLEKQHKALLSIWSDEQFQKCPLVPGENPQYWGRSCTVVFEHEGSTVRHKGLVVLSGPLRDEWRQTRKKQVQALEMELAQVRADIGKPRLRTVNSVQSRVNSKLNDSKVGKFIQVDVYETASGGINLHWRIDEVALAAQERLDGRYLLVTNDGALSDPQMFQLYRDKDGGEKRFFISKHDLKVSPVYLHHDQRIAAMLFINMLALLAYSLLQRQMHQQGLALTTRQLIHKLQHLTLIETRCHDGSRLHRLTAISPECLHILQLVAAALDDLQQNHFTPQPSHPLLMLGQSHCLLRC
jgi:transposase